MKKIAFYLFMVLCCVNVSCDDLDENDAAGQQEKTYRLTLECSLPEELKDQEVQRLEVDVKDVNTGKTYQFAQDSTSHSIDVNLKVGLYDATVTGLVRLVVGEDTLTKKIYGVQSAIEILDQPATCRVELFEPNENRGFVLAELFFTGSLNMEGYAYHADKYFVIYNNSDRTLYADSLAIAESKFLTVSKQEYHPDIMDTDMAVQALYMIPGDGHTYPVEPGGSLLICDNALDHTRANLNSFDLRKADFEWADRSTNPNHTDVNNPDVTDLEKIYCYTRTIWSPHDRGFCSYALVRMKTDIQNYLENYTYEFNYLLIGNAGQAEMSGFSYRVPNSWIEDVVNLSVQPMFQWLVVHPSLDRGWTHCGQYDYDESRFGKCVRRKVAERNADGKAVLKDTNNSTVDFETEQVADPFHRF